MMRHSCGFYRANRGYDLRLIISYRKAFVKRSASGPPDGRMTLMYRGESARVGSPIRADRGTPKLTLGQEIRNTGRLRGQGPRPVLVHNEGERG